MIALKKNGAEPSKPGANAQRVIFGLVAAFGIFKLTSCAFSAFDNTQDTQAASKRQEFFRIGEQVRVKRAIVGCGATGDFDKFYALLPKDRDAAFNFMERTNCRILKPGTEGEAADTSGWRNAVCLREKGDPDCVWGPWGAFEHL